jgi:hypothetical protein
MAPHHPIIRTACAVALVVVMAMPSLGHAVGGTGGGTGIIPSFGQEFPTPHAYVVVAPREWRTALDPLLDWRARTSYMNVTFLAYEDAMAIGNGRDSVAKLKDAIANVSRWSDGLEALMLVGDGSIIPVRGVFVNILGDGNPADPLNLRWTDDYYAYGTERSWDRDGDGIYGEDGEVLKEVAVAFAPYASSHPLVGRIPASTVGQVQGFVAKLLAYERDPPPGDWYGRALLVSGLMDAPNSLDNPYTPDWDGGYNQWSDNSYESHAILDQMLAPKYEVTWLYDYPYIEGGRWNTSVDTLDRGSLVSAFNRGNAIVSMNAHGWTDGTGIAHYNGSGLTSEWWDWSTAYDYYDASTASNGGMLPFVYIAACYVGDISLPGDRTLARLVLNPSGGAIGMVAGNGENYKGESETNASFGNWYLERRFWGYYQDLQPAAALVRTKVDYLALVAGNEVPHTPMYEAYHIADYLSHNFLGDPLTHVWRDPPRHMSITEVKDPDDEYRWISVKVVGDDGIPVSGARVSIRWGSGGEDWGMTDGAGGCRSSVPVDAGMLDILVTADGYQPAQIAIERPVAASDISIFGVHWGHMGEPDPPVVNGTTIQLWSYVWAHGSYEFDQVKVQFLVAKDGGAFERLLPDVYVPVEGHGSNARASHDWTPPEAGIWRVRVVVDPDMAFPDANRTNNVVEREVAVEGPPTWVGLPDEVTVDCRATPGGSIALRPFLRDPDTTLGNIALDASATYPAGGGPVSLYIDPDGVLWVRPSALASGSFALELRASDGTWTAGANLTVRMLLPASGISLVVPGPFDLRADQSASGQVTVVRPPGQPTNEVYLVLMTRITGLEFDQSTGSFVFTPERAGEFIAEVEARVAGPDGCRTVVASAAIVFHVSPGQHRAPMPVGWRPLEVAAGEEAKFQLPAYDPEGGAIAYSLSSKGGLDATIDPATGLLKLDPKASAAGSHTLQVTLSDGNASATYPLDVHVNERSHGGTGYGAYLVLGAVVLLVAAVVWGGRRRAAGRPKP